MVQTAMMIDDDADDLDVLKECVSFVDPTLSCLSFIYAEEALGLLASNRLPPPEFIFVDINMPKKTGMECLIELRKLETLRDTTIVMLSTSMPAHASEKLIKAGANFAFQKPYSHRGYHAILSKILRPRATTT